jgi:hypothetical protein
MTDILGGKYMDITGTCKITQVNNYFDPAKDRNIALVAAGMPVSHYLQAATPKEGYDFVVALDGTILPEDRYEGTVVKPGSNLVFAIVPRGGGDGKNPFRLIAMIAVIAVASWVGAGGLGGAFGPKTFAAYAAGAATGVVGGLLANALFPVRPADLSAGGSGLEQSATYGWTTVGNPMEEGATWPVLYGTMRVYPPIIGKYLESSGDQQYLNLLYGIADHKVDSITEPMINDQGAYNYQSIVVETRLGELNPPCAPKYFEDTVTETSIAVEVPRKTFSNTDSTTFIKRTIAGDTTNGIGVGIYLPALLYANDEGGISEATVDLVVEYAPNGTADDSGDWERLGEVAGHTVTIPTARWSAGYATYTRGAKQWHEVVGGSTNFGDHTEGDEYTEAPWRTHVYTGYEGFGEDRVSVERVVQVPVTWRWMELGTTFQKGFLLYGGNYVRITAASSSPIRRTYYKDGLSGETGGYDVRVGFMTAPNDSSRYQNRVFLDYLQKRIKDDFLYPGAATAVLRALATDNLSGGLPSVSWLVTRTTLDFVDEEMDSSAAERLGSNPAWAAYDLLYSWGRVDATDIDYAAFEDWADYCDEKGLTCGIYFDAQVNLRQALDYLGTLGLARVVQIGTEYTVLVDKPDDAVQRFLFTPGNIAADSWEMEISGVEDRANAIDVTYYDADSDYKRTVVFVQTTYFDEAATKPKTTKLDLVGCTDRDQAILIATRALNRNRYCTMTASWKADVDAIACRVGDVVECSHDVPQYGWGGRILAVEDSTHITLDREITFVVGETYYITTKAADDTRQTKQLVNPGDGGSYDEVEIASAFDPVPAAFDLYVVGITEEMTQLFRITDIQRHDDQTCIITAMEYNDNIYLDTADISAPETKSLLGAVRNMRVKEVYTGGSSTQARVTWTGYAMHWNVRCSILDTVNGQAVWRTLQEVSTRKTSVDFFGLEYGVEYIFVVIPYPEIDGWEATTLTLVGKTYPPGDVGAITTEPFEDGVTFSWERVDDFDLRGYKVAFGVHWKAERVYQVDDVVVPTDGTEQLFKCTTAGTAGSTEPTWPTSGTVSDGSAVWTEDSDSWQSLYSDVSKFTVELTARQRTLQGTGTDTVRIWCRAIDAFGNLSVTVATVSDACLNTKGVLLPDPETPSGSENEYISTGPIDIQDEMHASNDSGEVIFEVVGGSGAPVYVQGYADHKALELELMKMNFQYVSWAQFSIYEAFDDETKRHDPEPGTYSAAISRSMLTNGGDDTANREFVFTSKTYSDMTTILQSTGTADGNTLTDSSMSWYENEVKNLTCKDSASSTFNVESNTGTVMTLDGAPASGQYELYTDNPAYMVAFISYLDSSNGGYGYVKFEVSFDNGSNWQTVLDTSAGVNKLGSTQEIDDPGVNYKARVTIKNNAVGQGAVVYKFLIATDPSPWRF